MSGRYLTSSGLGELEAKLTNRDLAVIRRVSELRFVSGPQLTRLHFVDSPEQSANARSARRALLRLSGLDLLARLARPVGGVRAGSAGFVYHLGLAGQRLAVARGWQPERRGRRSSAPGTLFVRHSLQVAELHVRLTEADRSRRLELLELNAEPACWRSWSGSGTQRPRLKPDSYVRLGLGAFEYSDFLEIDRGTEGSRAIDRQLRLYVAYFNSGQEQQSRGVFPITLWLAPTLERARAIEDCVRRLPMASRELFQVARFDEALSLMLEPKTNE